MNQPKTKTRNADIFFQLTRRHLLVFFKNKIRLMYTLLVPVIIFVVYIFFLRDLEISGIKSALAQAGLVPDLDADIKTAIHGLMGDARFWKYVHTLVDSWMISGILGLTAITVSLQTNSVIVEDKQNGVNRDFASSPIYRNTLIASYFFYNFIITILVCLVFFLICIVYLLCMGEFALTFANFMTVLTVLLYSTIAATLMTVFICSFVKSEGTMASIVAIFSTAVGFLIGAYMPLAMLPEWVQGICGFIPGTYSCALLRYGLMATPLTEMTAYLSGIIPPEFCTQLIETLTGSFGYNLNFFGVSVNAQYQSLAIAVFIIAFLLLNIGVGKQLATVLGLGRAKSGKKHKRKSKD